MNGGYFSILLNGVDSFARASNRHGEQRLATIEKHLRKSGVEFVEDFESEDTVVVRYGDLIHDEIWTMYDNRKSLKEK